MPRASGSSPVLAAEHERAVAAVLEIVEADQLLDRHGPGPLVDAMNAIQVELLQRRAA